MDPTNSFLGRMILEEMTPIVMVLSTPLAEYACQKNGLNFVEMLLPFSNFNKLDVPVRTASDQPYRLQMFRLRLVYASDVHQQNYEAAEEQLKQVVSSASETTLSDLQSDPPQPETVLRKSESDYQPSWIQTFNKGLIRTLSFSEHEAFDHPVACLLVVSSKDEQPINRFVDLFNTDRLPSLLNEGAMDPKILKHYLLLHDNQDGTPEKAASILAEMRSTFGSSECKLLCINSVQDASDVGKDNPWVHYKIHASLSLDIACFLSADDLHWIKEFMQDLSSKHIIPHMEQKIRVLNQQVSATRKGFRNQIRNLWWRKGKEDPPEAPSGSTYTFSSIESQIRVLGDYAFMLRDYELALSNYRLLSTDYKLDKAWKHHAGVQEMMGLSLFMLDQSRKDSEYCMETAFTTYLKLGASGQRNATRCGLWWAEMLKTRGQYKDAANVYFRISNEEPSLHAAVMLEQASCCYLFTDPPMLRKYAFHLVLAGNRYYVSHQREHAIRMYKSALSIYKGNAWNIINDHVHFNVGRWYAVLGIYDVAVKHMLEVLACTHQSLPTQDLFLHDFFHIVENMGKTFEINKLQLPVIDMSSLKVIYEDHRTYASSSDVNVSESLWQSLEEEMVPLIPGARSNWLESHSKISPSKKPNNSQICIVGEAIKLDIELKNPLQISISISSMSLICELSGRSEETNLVHDADKNISPSGRQDDVELEETPSFRDLSFASSSFTLSEPDFVLGGGETKRIQLDVTPNVEGILKIIGVKWKLSRFVVGYHYFEFDTKKKQRRRKKGAEHSSSSGLSFIVIKGLPKLEGCIHHIPRKAYAGDLRLLTLELRNQSEYTVKNMKMKISHPRFLIPGNSGDLNMDFPSCLGEQKSSDSKDVPTNIMDSSKSLLFLFPNGTTILGGSTFVWPLWFHSALSGNASLYISIYYEMENCSGDMAYRTLRMHYDVEVVPSLDLSFLITPCPSRLQEFLVRMDIVNRTSSESFSLQQLSCASNQWEISPLPACGSICPSPMLLAGQALSCFFKIKDTLGSSNNKNPLMVQGHDVPLGSQGSGDVLIDVSRSPLAEFQHHERCHQGKSAEGSSSTVDFILISKTLGNDPNLELEVPKLLSNHACHCSITSKSPIWWLMDGPPAITHDFSASFCEASFHVTICNCSKDVVSIRISTFDSALDVNLLSDTIQSSDFFGNRGGWHDISLLNEMKVTSDVQGVRAKKSALSQGISSFIWCASSSTQLKLGPACSEEVCMRICVFSPGTYDLSNYEVHWKVLPSDDEVTNDAKRLSSGISKGYPFYFTVLQSS